jgi:hypothetical protein
MRGEKFREASAHASGEVSACVFLFGNLPASRLRLSRHFLIAQPPLLARPDGEGTAAAKRGRGGQAKMFQLYDLPALTAFGRPLLVRRGIWLGLNFYSVPLN